MMMVHRIFLVLIVHPHSSRRNGANVSSHYGVLVGTEGTFADRLLEYVGGVSVVDRDGSYLLHTVAERKEVRIGRRS